jgi:hypothetical protein
MFRKQNWLILLITFAVVVSGCSTSPPNGDVSGERLKIFASTKYKGVELLFTESVETYARADGSNYDHAIREVGWDLISAIGNSATATPGLQAIVFNRINYKERRSFIALGIIVNGKFQRLNKSGQPEDPGVRRFLDELARQSVMVMLAANEPGVELSMSRN